MISRFLFRPASAVARLSGALLVPLAFAGCGDVFSVGTLSYVASPDLKTKLGEKPDLQKNIREQLLTLFGADPQHIKVPKGSGLPGGGIYLASHQEAEPGKIVQIKQVKAGQEESGATNQVGGYGLYRRHCVHCHGVSGAGDGPTAPFLFPRPRDYRNGTYKFTSTISGRKPTRADLRKTIKNGLHGTSMPAFEALMTDAEIEQVLDYTIFLSMRGEVERTLVEDAASAGELTPESIEDDLSLVFRKWKNAETEVENPPIPRTPSSRDSILRGRELFLGRTPQKLECTGCHGPQALGNGPSFIDQDIFNRVVFGGDPSAQADRLKQEADRIAEETRERTGDVEAGKKAAEKMLELWTKGSLDEWGNPLRRPT